MALELRDLEVFVAVDRQGSFGRAATQLLVTQPAVSERIRHLERTVGASVFVRTTRGVTLTPAGEALLPYAHRCLVMAQEAVAATRSADGLGPFGIAVHSTFAPRVVPLVLDALGPHPRRVTVKDAHSEDIATLLLDRVADVGFAVPGPAVPGTRRRWLRPDPIVAVCAPDHPLASVRRPALSRLRDSFLAVNAWGSGAEAFLDRLRAAGVDDGQVRYCADATTAMTLAADRGHLAFVTESAASVLVREGVLTPIRLAGLTSWVVRLQVLHRSRGRDDEAVAAVVAHLASATTT
jgi:DNA-binding transcriptional LysR family regulator